MVYEVTGPGATQENFEVTTPNKPAKGAAVHPDGQSLVFVTVESGQLAAFVAAGMGTVVALM